MKSESSNILQLREGRHCELLLGLLAFASADFSMNFFRVNVVQLRLNSHRFFEILPDIVPVLLCFSTCAGTNYLQHIFSRIFSFAAESSSILLEIVQ